MDTKVPAFLFLEKNHESCVTEKGVFSWNSLDGVQQNLGI